MVHILLIEDNPADVILVREALRTCPIPADVLIAYDGEQALSVLSAPDVRPDFIMLDLNLPKFSGHGFLERFRADGRFPVIVFSNSSDEIDRQRAMSLGARDYVTKPTVFREFINAVHGIIARWSLKEEGATG